MITKRGQPSIHTCDCVPDTYSQRPACMHSCLNCVLLGVQGPEIIYLFSMSELLLVINGNFWQVSPTPEIKSNLRLSSVQWGRAWMDGGQVGLLCFGVAPERDSVTRHIDSFFAQRQNISNRVLISEYIWDIWSTKLGLLFLIWMCITRTKYLECIQISRKWEIKCCTLKNIHSYSNWYNGL